MGELLAGLGRVKAPDGRDLQYLLPRKVAAAENIARRIWASASVLDQGGTSQCVAYSTRQWLRSSPVRQDMPMSEADFYAACQANDEWPGSETEEPRYEGTSVRAAMKQLKALGLASAYSWAFRVEPVIAHILAHGPMVVGTDWCDDSFMPDRHGYISFAGNLVGGHAYLLIGADRERINSDGTKGALRIVNSWGRGWGSNGRAWISFADMDLLLRTGGEAAVAHEVKPA